MTPYDIDKFVQVFSGTLGFITLAIMVLLLIEARKK